MITPETKKKLVFCGVISGIALLMIIIIACMGASISHKNEEIKELKLELTVAQKEIQTITKQKITEDKIDKDFSAEIKGGEELNEEDKNFFNKYFNLFNNYTLKLPNSN